METQNAEMLGVTRDNPLSRVPPEIWERITEHVSSSKDLINLSEVIPTCKNLLYSKRVEWLFYQVLPLVMNNTYGEVTVPLHQDLLNCRLVCKHWKFGVVYFYENNVRHYPASGDDIDLKLNRCHFGLTSYLNGSKIISKNFKISKMKKMLNEAVDHPNNPIVGGYVHLEVSEEDCSESVNLTEEFIATFGRHIYNLRLHFVEDTNPIRVFTMLLNFLQNLPILKGLVIDRISWSSDFYEKQCSVKKLKQVLYQIIQNIISTENSKVNLPKLETLDLQFDGLIGNILKQTVINIFCMESIKSLTLVESVTSKPDGFKFSNLLHLCLHMDSNEQLESVLSLDCPIVRKLDLEVMYDELDYDLLYKVLQKFQGSINHLALQLPDVLETVNKNERMKMTRFFTTPNTLQMPNIKTISLFGWRPPSLNFICGDNFCSLEYLNLYLENGDEEENPLLEYPLCNVKNKEITDVMSRLNPIWSECWSWKQLEMCKSNIWNVFPKLKCIFIARYDLWQPLRRNGWTSRRNNLLAV